MSLKAALLVPTAHLDAVRSALADGTADGWCELSAAHPGGALLLSGSRRTRGRPLEAAGDLLREMADRLPRVPLCVQVTGAGSSLLAGRLGAGVCNDFQAAACAVDQLLPRVRTVFELGGETSRYLRLAPDPASGRLGIVDYGTNGDCAAGTGGFLDQQAGRLNFSVEEIGDVVGGAGRAAQIAGRCSVFAKSDMIHAQQKGFGPPEVLRGLCDAVAANYKSAVVKGRPVSPPVALLGGVAANAAVAASLREVLELSENELIVPPGAESYGAIGAALLARQRAPATPSFAPELLSRLEGGGDGAVYSFPTASPLRLDGVQILRDREQPYRFPEDAPVRAYLGLDIGSVGTKLALLDERGEVIHSIFTRTEGRPIEVVARCLRELEEAIGWGIEIVGVGATGSGRELIGELVGADGVHDEITCHKTGAAFIGDRLLDRRPDTIFEIGGQDSKFIRLEAEPRPDEAAAAFTNTTPAAAPGHSAQPAESIVVDFTMNEACAAGTGSFLEERAAELGVSIKDEFAALAFSSQAPIRLGERCTVFMERDVNTYMQRGAKREDVIAGLAYSIAQNYLNRVVRGRPIGDCIFFQGGTAYNDAVAAAFSMLTGKPIIVPPHNAILGAIGAALLARDKISQSGEPTRFRGCDLSQVNYTLREFTCRGCGNACSIQEFNVEGEKTFWGDKCSDRYRKQARSERTPIIRDLVGLRRELLFADDTGNPADARGLVGIPLAMYTWDLLPLWRRFFRDCGFAVAVSTATNRQTIRDGMDCVVAEPCFPIIVAHGHVAELVSQQVDYVWLPNIISAAEHVEGVASHVCPWGSTLPFVIRQAPAFRHWQGRILCPTLSLERGEAEVERELVRMVHGLGVRKGTARDAFAAGMEALRIFRAAYAAAGRDALETLQQSTEPGIVLVGRPYNIYDSGVSLSVARKLREQYGVNVLPVDALPLADIEIADINDNMYWAYGRKILAAAKLVSQHANLHIIYVTNFKCGPDSFLKAFTRPAAGKPLLTLQFDGHSNDAGMMTRCEAYLDSKGILRWWRTCRSSPESELLPDAPFTSPRCPTPLRG